MGVKPYSEDKLLYQEQYKWHREVDLIGLVAKRAGDIALRYWNTGLTPETKSDASPVTIADRECEQAIARALEEAFPDDGLLGEEGAAKNSRSGRRWIIDPIDGTRNYSRGIPVWATLISLEEDGHVVLGVVSAPALHRRWWAERGAGAHAGGDVVHVSAVRRPEDAVLSFALEQSVPALAGRAWHARGYGDFWSHMLVAEGSVDGAIDAIGVSVWDLAAVQVIVEEAGGTFTDFAGEQRIDGNSAISSNGLLHAELLEAVRELDP